MAEFQPRGLETIELPVDALTNPCLIAALRIWRLLDGGQPAPGLSAFTPDAFPADLKPLAAVARVIDNQQLQAVLERKAPVVFQTVFEEAEDFLATKTNLRLPFVDADNEVGIIHSPCVVLKGEIKKDTGLKQYWRPGNKSA